MPRVSDASSCSNGVLDTARNMVTAAFMMNAARGARGRFGRDKPFSDNRKIVPEIVFHTCLNGF